MLGWFVESDVVSHILTTDSLVEETEVEVRPEKIPMKCLDENVCITSIRKYFTYDAWSLVTDVMETMHSKGTWICSSCSKDLHSFGSVCCDSCLDWHHLKCVGLSQSPIAKHWYCRSCHV